MGRLRNNKANAILDAAVKGKYAIPAICVVARTPHPDSPPRPQQQRSSLNSSL